MELQENSYKWPKNQWVTELPADARQRSSFVARSESEWFFASFSSLTRTGPRSSWYWGGTRVSSSSLGQVTKTNTPKRKKQFMNGIFAYMLLPCFLWKFSCMKHAGMFSSEIFRINSIRKKNKNPQLDRNSWRPWNGMTFSDISHLDFRKVVGKKNIFPK